VAFKELRDSQGHLVGRFDPQREILELQSKSRGVKALFDLRQLREDAQPDQPKPLRPKRG